MDWNDIFKASEPNAWWAGRSRNVLLGTIVTGALTAWALYHFGVAAHALFSGSGNSMATVWLVALLLLWWIPVCWFERPVTTTDRQWQKLLTEVVTVQVPVYNEDEDSLRRCLQSVFDQTRRVDRIRVVDDGSEDKARGVAITYDATKAWFFANCARLGIYGTWDRTVNRGKRYAQMEVLTDDPGDIFVTLDSDSILDVHAIEEGLMPFKDPKVMSVAGCVVVLNSRANFLTAMICMLYTPFTRGFRSAQSVLGSVMVNSGTLAFYRADVIRKRAHVYPHERFAGHEMQMNDDSMMTMYAMMDGRTVHQPSCVVFTLVPEKWKHYRNQSMRWMRGTFVRTLWWIRYMPLTSPAFWMPVIELTQLLLALFIGAYLVLGVASAPAGSVSALIVPAATVTIAMNYLIGLRYFMIQRDDTPLWWEILVFLLAPLAAVWRFCVLRPMHLYALVTCWKVKKWGTRETVEVAMTGSS